LQTLDAVGKHVDKALVKVLHENLAKLMSTQSELGIPKDFGADLLLFLRSCLLDAKRGIFAQIVVKGVHDAFLWAALIPTNLNLHLVEVLLVEIQRNVLKVEVQETPVKMLLIKEQLMDPLLDRHKRLFHAIRLSIQIASCNLESTH